MSQTEALKTWMEQNRYTNATLAAKLGCSYDAVYSVINRPDRPINDKFRWRFAQAFGWEEASRLFGQEREYA